MTRTFASDPFLHLPYFANEFGKSVKYLNDISLVQRGLMVKKEIPPSLAARYPKFEKGPGGRIGMYASKYRRWRAAQGSPLEAA